MATTVAPPHIAVSAADTTALTVISSSQYFQALCFHDEVSEMSLPVSDDITHFLCLHKLPFSGIPGKTADGCHLTSGT